ncbi:Coenzyme F420 hydrogenase/dehydrogenase, beta subunit C-terminal domain [Lachnoclostridium phytofermentans]|uniref:Coenzyme F420 hydrogenase/dehydrogenase, beta subunit C-terminal domain n=1 Tax=Lachnoclostridium phytofermentans TaxID=66219 RepID=UPI0006913907|nr:Coenzyme F420 hydrogenase/dehydrogenase, beta subunit C-terminal domain [Lachnoclostridium phytofermentans]
MKIGIVGYAKPEIESLLQAYAVKKVLEDQALDCYWYRNKDNVTYKSTRTARRRNILDSLSRRQYIHIDLNEVRAAQEGFIRDRLSLNQNKTEKADSFVIVNHKSTIDTTNSNASYIDFYQRSYELKSEITEALLLCDLAEYEKIMGASPKEQSYVFMDCESDKSGIIPSIRRIAKANKLEVISKAYNRTFYGFEKVTEIFDPSEYLAYIRDAKLVVTDSFATVYFAILLKKPLICYDQGMTQGKIKRFLQRLSMMESYFTIKPTETSLKAYAMKHPHIVSNQLMKYRMDLTDRLLDSLGVFNLDQLVNCPTKITRGECCGCYACKEVCPTDAIQMLQDKEGFYYPNVNKEKCINCGLCEKVCVKRENSQIVSYEPDYPKVYSAINKDENVRMISTSGGVFHVLSKYAIEQREGVVVGVKFDDEMNAVSTLASTMKDVKAFYGSKYVKSEIDGVYEKVKEQLNAGRFVLYSGLPCECAGLKAYLRKDYENLFISEILCHAAPSPKVFKTYLKFLSIKYKSPVTNVVFRDKRNGWLIHKCSMVVEFKDRKPLVVNARRNNYFRNFLLDNIQRPGCSNCSFVGRKRVGDITIGDFWGIHHIDEEMFDDKGTSAIMVNTVKGEKVLEELKASFFMKERSIKELFKYNHSKPCPLKPEREEIFKRLGKERIDSLLESFNDLKNKAK